MNTPSRTAAKLSKTSFILVYIMSSLNKQETTSVRKLKIRNKRVCTFYKIF